ncbi:DUF423 domain-containing protein [Pseudomaricurvus alkylphenolicus]|jgi:uncharacterized membrane protein YgdD (TMEM256/DUF423 family)|uniref:DUF423 domain-containing protein n=1 Tax=Pseudomaricurvus alkylphenolicus TaxID=1306991 RepID=UPI001423882D|nr:DUF423 domain-containing protein [Pseudomaricurvus alkylphenolicus]NIB39560.1 DUF423 domain-containing protein [Pseudomaricurvus alkylphenolicus]
MAKQLLVLASVSGLLAVVLGAFAAHGLKGRVDAAMLSAFQTGVQYQFYHTLALILVALLLLRFPESGMFLWAGIAFVVGILLFSGSLYALALGGPRWLGPVTPLGGVSFMVGWICLFVASWRMPTSPI